MECRPRENNYITLEGLQKNKKKLEYQHKIEKVQIGQQGKNF